MKNEIEKTDEENGFIKIPITKTKLLMQKTAHEEQKAREIAEIEAKYEKPLQEVEAMLTKWNESTPKA